MAAANGNHDELLRRLDRARRSGTPLVAINTPDQPATIAAIAKWLGTQAEETPAFVWDFVQGMRPGNEAAMKDSGQLGMTQENPIEALRVAYNLPNRSMLFYYNAQRFLQDAGVCQGLLNLRDEYKASDRMIILLGTGISLPGEIASDVIVLSEPLPDDERLLHIVSAQVNNAGEQFTKKPTPEMMKRAATALRGTSAFGAEQLSAMSLRADGIDIETLSIQAKALIEQTPGLTFERGKETFSDIGGLGFIKEFGTRIFKGPKAPAVVVRVEELEKSMAGARGDLSGTSGDALQVLLSELEDNNWSGLLAYGVPGAGKSLIAKSLANTHQAKAIRFDMNACKGSLVGQSLHPDEEIYICGAGGQNVRRMTIKEAHQQYCPGDDWFTWTVGRHGGAEIRRVTSVIKHNRNHKFIRVTTRSGRTVVVTEDHALFKLRRAPMPAAIGALTGGDAARKIGSVLGSYSREDALESVATSDLQIGDRVAIVHHLPRGQNHDKYVRTSRIIIPATKELMQLAGLWVGDGSMATNMLRISSSTDDPEVVAFLREMCDGPLTESVKPGKGRDYILNDIGLAAALRLMDVTGKYKKARTKRVPAWLFGANREVVAAFLRGYFSADGGVESHSVCANTVSPRLAQDIALLLGRLGVFARIRTKKRPEMGYPIYRIIMSKALEISRFADRIGFMQKAKTDKLAALLQRRPIRKYISGRHLNGVFWDEVVSLETLDDASQPRDCYDLSIEGVERFISGGVVVHNSERQIRQAMQVIRTIGGDRVFFIGSCNRLDSLPPELQRRFRAGVWFFDLPDKSERETIWKINRKRYNIPADDQHDDEEDLTGADIRNICEQAYMLQCSLAEARRYVVPLKQQSKSEIEASRTLATGRFTDASRGGVYDRSKQPAARERRIKVGA